MPAAADRIAARAFRSALSRLGQTVTVWTPVDPPRDVAAMIDRPMPTIGARISVRVDEIRLTLLAEDLAGHAVSVPGDTSEPVSVTVDGITYPVRFPILWGDGAHATMLVDLDALQGSPATPGGPFSDGFSDGYGAAPAPSGGGSGGPYSDGFSDGYGDGSGGTGGPFSDGFGAGFKT